jgi:hypothetical protein
MADADVPEPPGVDRRVRGDVAEDGEFIIELQRPAVNRRPIDPARPSWLA